MILITGPRGSGRTTKLIQYIIDWMAENEGEVIVIAAPNMKWATAIKDAFYGMPDIQIIGPHRCYEQLRGRSKSETLIAIDNSDLIQGKEVQQLSSILSIFDHVVCVEESL